MKSIVNFRPILERLDACGPKNLDVINRILKDRGLPPAHKTANGKIRFSTKHLSREQIKSIFIEIAEKHERQLQVAQTHPPAFGPRSAR